MKSLFNFLRGIFNPSHLYEGETMQDRIKRRRETRIKATYNMKQDTPHINLYDKEAVEALRLKQAQEKSLKWFEDKFNKRYRTF